MLSLNTSVYWVWLQVCIERMKGNSTKKIKKIYKNSYRLSSEGISCHQHPKHLIKSIYENNININIKNDDTFIYKTIFPFLRSRKITLILLRSELNSKTFNQS